jgi:hypothetical protein
MSQGIESKQASQAVDFLKLFQQVGRSFIGLFLIAGRSVR